MSTVHMLASWLAALPPDPTPKAPPGSAAISGILDNLKWLAGGALIAGFTALFDGLQAKAHELDAYLGFLKGGCRQFPLDLLRGAGVDMETPEAVNTALAYFDRLVGELDELI